MGDDPGSTIGSMVLYLLLVLGCAYFAGTEISLASVNRIHMMSYADNGDRRAKRVLEILDRFDEALSALLIGNNIMNIGCATLTVVLVTDLWSSGARAVSVGTLITTVVLYLFGEMLPKCFARSCNEDFAMTVAGSLLFLMKLLRPLTVFFTAVSRAVSRPFRYRASAEVTVTEDELQELVENISTEDGFDEDTGNLVRSAFRFPDRTAGMIMRPWAEVLTVSMGMKTPQVLQIIQSTGHSRLPVIGRNGDVRGILQIRRFLRTYIKKQGRVLLASVMDPPYRVGPDLPLDELFSRLSSHRRNLAIVEDGDGTLLGIVTMEDIMEELVGEIYDEDDVGGEADV